MIEARGLAKSYGKRRALAPLDLRIEAGELVALLGANGAGKTTALGMLSGQLVPDEGHALLGSHDVFAEPLPARRCLGYVAQDTLLPAQLTVKELAEFACAVKSMPLDRRELQRLLELTALDGDGDRAVGELSHGMQRKAGWVVALVTEPEALLLDEGLAGLDAASSAALAKEVVGRLRRKRCAVLWTEHDLALLTPAVTRAVVLAGGELVETVDGDRVRALAEAEGFDGLLARWTGGDRRAGANEEKDCAAP